MELSKFQSWLLSLERPAMLRLAEAEKAIVMFVKKLESHKRDVVKENVLISVCGFSTPVKREAWMRLESRGVLVKKPKRKADGSLYENRFAYYLKE